MNLENAYGVSFEKTLDAVGCCRLFSDLPFHICGQTFGWTIEKHNGVLEWGVAMGIERFSRSGNHEKSRCSGACKMEFPIHECIINQEHMHSPEKRRETFGHERPDHLPWNSWDSPGDLRSAEFVLLLIGLRQILNHRLPTKKSLGAKLKKRRTFHSGSGRQSG